MRRVALFILVAFAFLVAPVSAAAPRIIVIYGAIVPKPIVLTDWREHSDLMEAITAPVGEQSLEGRPYVQVALFWDSRWKQYMDDGKSADKLTPDQADQHARFYPAINGLKPLFVYEREQNSFGQSAMMVGLVRAIEQSGLDYLARHGVRTQM